MIRYLSLLVVVAAVVFGPAALVTATGRPLIMDCQNLTPATCEEALSYWSEDFESRGSSGPIITFTIKSLHGGTCGDVDIAYWWFLVGRSADPLC